MFERANIIHLFVFVLFMAPISAYLLRQNNLKMIELRQVVLEIDEQTGDIEKVEPELNKLANFVLNHMNTDLGRVDLPGTYNAAIETLRQEAQASGNGNASIYAQAQKVCEDPNVLLTARAQCVQDYVLKNAAPGTDAIDLKFPDKTLYSYSFSSPVWSPDLAGFSLLITILSVFLLAMLIVARFILPLISRLIDQDPLE